jgi:hypothetical protein
MVRLHTPCGCGVGGCMPTPRVRPWLGVGRRWDKVLQRSPSRWMGNPIAVKGQKRSPRAVRSVGSRWSAPPSCPRLAPPCPPKGGGSGWQEGEHGRGRAAGEPKGRGAACRGPKPAYWERTPFRMSRPPSDFHTHNPGFTAHSPREAAPPCWRRAPSSRVGARAVQPDGEADRGQLGGPLSIGRAAA